MKVAEIDKKLSGPGGEVVCGGLVEERRMAEKNSRDDEACGRSYTEKKDKDFFAVMDEKIAQGDGGDPGNRSQDAALRASSLAVGEERVIEEKRKADEEEAPKKISPPTVYFHKPQEGEKIERRVEEESIPLVEEIIQKSFHAGPERNVEESLFESFCPVWRHHPFVDGEGRECPVEAINEDVEENHGNEGQGRKGQDFASRLVPFDEEIKRNKKEGPEEEVILQAEPGEEAEKEAGKNHLENGKRRSGGDFSENIKRE